MAIGSAGIVQVGCVSMATVLQEFIRKAGHSMTMGSSGIVQVCLAFYGQSLGYKANVQATWAFYGHGFCRKCLSAGRSMAMDSAGIVQVGLVSYGHWALQGLSRWARCSMPMGSAEIVKISWTFFSHGFCRNGTKRLRV